MWTCGQQSSVLYLCTLYGHVRQHMLRNADSSTQVQKKEGFIRAIKCRKMICVRHVSCAEGKALSLQGNMKAIDRLED